jgi:tetratricopeptide (TPR) repeat protein/ribosomal protein L40E
MSQQPASLNYADFAVCRACHAVNFIAAATCRSCGRPAGFQSIPEAARSVYTHRMWGWAWVLFVGLILCQFLVGVPLVLIAIPQLLWGAKNAARSRQNEYTRQATELLVSLARTQKEAAEGAYKVGLAAFEAGNFGSAAEKLEKTVSLGRRDPHTVYALAAAYYNGGQYAPAIPLFEEVVAQTDAPPEARELLARAYVAAGVSDTAQAEWLLSVAPDRDATLRAAIADILVDYVCRGGTSDQVSRRILQGAHALCPASPKCVAALADFLLRTGAPEGAVACCSSLALDQHTEASLRVYAHALDEAGREDADSLTVYFRHLAGAPIDTAIAARLGRALASLGRWDEAIAVYEDGLRRAPEDCRLRYHLALAHRHSGAIHAAIAELQTLVRMPSFEAYRAKDDVHRLLGGYFVENRMLDAARKQYLVAGRSEATLQGLYELADLFQAAGRREDAQACWAEIYAADITFRDVASRVS